MEKFCAVSDALVKPAVLFERAEASQRVVCRACAHGCAIEPDARGICRVRYNDGGILNAPYGYVSALAVDPIEKKPFYHFLPNSKVLSYGMLGCNFSCSFCQNWEISQFLKGGAREPALDRVSAEEIISYAVNMKTPSIASTYNEPFITSEWSFDLFTLARKHGIRTVYVSNGFASERALSYIMPVLDACNVDLKSFNDETYRRIMGGRLRPVLDTIETLWRGGKWVEVTTLVVPGLNDSDSELAQIAEFVAGVSADMPWHVTAFHPMFKMTGVPGTGAETLARAVRAGRNAGLKYVYSGNMAGGPDENTVCPSCKKVIIERQGFSVISKEMDGAQCRFCGCRIAGLFS
ncbi:MAG: AmmeMemoRadiSam system radical SAM enzyme [Elusimicrobiaceae bacterium]|jgi:pyruvate formate lyase activating enzyme